MAAVVVVDLVASLAMQVLDILVAQVAEQVAVAVQTTNML
jgi:hypothetical protein